VLVPVALPAGLDLEVVVGHVLLYPVASDRTFRVTTRSTGTPSIARGRGTLAEPRLLPVVQIRPPQPCSSSDSGPLGWQPNVLLDQPTWRSSRATPAGLLEAQSPPDASSDERLGVGIPRI
jgi:hypothetical protein